MQHKLSLGRYYVSDVICRGAYHHWVEVGERGTSQGFTISQPQFAGTANLCNGWRWGFATMRLQHRPPLSSSVRPPYQMGRLTQYTRQYNLTQRSPAMLEIAAEFALVESNSLIKFGSQSYHHRFTRDKTNCPVHFNPVLLLNSGFD